LSYKTPTWDIMLGWLLGFRSYTSYEFSPTNPFVADYVKLNNYTFNTNTGTMTITADTCVNLFMYNNFYIVLDDYTQNHLNDGLVTASTKSSTIPLPPYSNSSTHVQTPTGRNVISHRSSASRGTMLTRGQTYSASQLLANSSPTHPVFSTPPHLKDIFALLPLKLTGLAPGATYSESGGSLQDNDRKYFGPVNLRRLTIQLINDRGDIVNLNGADWSFSIVCDYLYTSSRI
jgi:hypothetical protein